VLDKSQPPEAMFFLTLPSGLSLLSLTDVLRTELNMPELRTYSLGAFAASPSLAINREDQMTLIAPQGQPFFATREERIFLTGEESVHPLRLFRSADFTARITDMPHKYPLSMQFTFKRPMTDHAYAFFMVDQHGILLRIKPRPFGRQPPATQPGTPFVVP